MNNEVVGPALVEILGMNAPLLSLVSGVGSVLLVRIMLLSREYTLKTTWWVYNVALTLLLMCAAFVFILDKNIGPGTSMIFGIGLGSSGVVLIDVAKRYLEVIVGRSVNSEPGLNGKK